MTSVRVLALVAVTAVLVLALFEGCGGRIDVIAVGVDIPPAPDAATADAATADATDASLDADAREDSDASDAAVDSWDGADAWDGYYDPYALPPSPYDAAAFPPCYGTNPNPDHGAPSTTYPAFEPTMPSVVPAGGPTMLKPNIVAITFTDDELSAQIDQFVSSLGASQYWASSGASYGIAPPTASLVSATDPILSRWTDGQVQDWITTHLDGTHPEFPPPSANNLYTLFLPDNVDVAPPPEVSVAGFGCADYHYQTTIPGRPTVTYAVVPRCGGGPGSIEGVTVAASHALVGAFTNPSPTSPGITIDSAHFLFGYVAQSLEPPALCSQGSPVAPTADLPFWVQPQWSNSASSAWHDPCQPAQPGEPSFFAAVPVLKDMVTVTYPPPNQSQTVSTLGADIPLKLCAVIEVDLISDGPLDMPMQLSAFESGTLYDPCPDPPPPGGCNPPTLSLQFSWDNPQGYNGEKRYLTVAVTGESATSGYDAFFLSAIVDGQQRKWPVAIGPGFPP